MKKRKIVILTGAGMSAESGIKTFRDSNGLWENHRVEEVASPEAWRSNPQLVLDFYNQRRKQLYEVNPNEGHRTLVKLEDQFDVHIITQNVDDLHERAESSQVVHLHGELKKVRSEHNEKLITTLEGWELKLGDLAQDGAQLRPHIVWFGEAVPLMNLATALVQKADIFIIIGTSLNVYPAAGLVYDAPTHCKKYYIDPHAYASQMHDVELITATATQGVPALVNQLLKV
jgi:NAD-dependent deacetylase